MNARIEHDLKVQHSKDEQTRQFFVSGLRRYVFNTMAQAMKTTYEDGVEQQYRRRHGQAPGNDVDIHKAMRGAPVFQFYSAMRTATQKMLWRSVMPAVERQAGELAKRAGDLSGANNQAQGTLTLDPELTVPDYVADIDVHLMPGSYSAEYMADDVSMGAVFENGVAVLSMGFMGERLEDIGQSIAAFVAAKHPSFAPARILDLGCTIGHSTLPWAEAYPDAEVHAIDVAAPMLRYAHGRAQSLGITAHFHQQDAVAPRFEDGSFDLIFSSMFLHELHGPQLDKTFREIHRMLRPGGMMLHYELPPAAMKQPYENFYLNWDSYYNNEPFYKAFRDGDPVRLCTDAGFAPDKFFRFVTPSLNLHGHDAITKAAQAQQGAMAKGPVGQLVDGVNWFGFGCWK